MLQQVIKELVIMIENVTIREWIMLVITILSISGTVGTYAYFFRKLKDTLTKLTEALVSISKLSDRVDDLEKQDISITKDIENITNKCSNTEASIKHIDKKLNMILMNVTALLNKAGNEITTIK